MAAKTGLKQQCPNCDALIPIKEAQVGKRIKCPRCGDPFRVEDIDEAPPLAKPGREAANGKKTNTKGKTNPGRQRDDDDSPKLKKKKGDGANSKVLMGVVFGGVALVALAVAGYFVFFNDKPKPPPQVAATSQPSPQPPDVAPSVPTPPPGTPADNPTITPLPAGQEAPTGASPTAPTILAGTGGPIANMLLNDTQFVLNLPMKEVLKNPMGHLAVDHASAQRTLGFPVDHIDQVIASGSVSPPWIMVYIRTNKPVPFENVKKALQLSKAPESPFEGQDFFQSQTNFGEALDSFLPDDYQSSVVRSTPIMVKLQDAQTLVIGDLIPMKKFLAAKGRPEAQKPVPGTNPDGSSQTPGGFPSGSFGEQPVVLSSNYLTIEPNLKRILDQLEAGASPYLFSSVIDYTGELGEAKDSFDLWAAGLALHWPGGTERIVGMGVWQCRNDDATNRVKQRFDEDINRIALPAFILKKIKIKTGDVKKPGEKTQETAPGGVPGGGPPGAPSPPGGKGGPPGELPPGPAPGPGPGNPNPGQPSQPTNPGEIPDALADARITIDLKTSGRTIVGFANFDLEQNFMDSLFEAAKPYLTRGHGELEMASSNPHPFRLGAAVKSYSQKEDKLPQGAARRDAAASRFKRPWPPHQRISWMADLLPHLGHQQTYDRIDFKRSWSDPENVNTASTLIPEFLAPGAPHRSWYVRYPGVGPEVAATSYIGIAGIGLDATQHDTNDPKRGIFAYDRSTRLSDIESLAKTILLIQVPPAEHVPWMSGGGTTVRGVPDKNSIEAFLPPKGKGVRSTLIIMADGSVRTVTESISDDVLKSLAVIKGKKAEVKLDTEAPPVKPPEATMKAAEATPAAPAQPVAPPGG